MISTYLHSCMHTYIYARKYSHAHICQLKIFPCAAWVVALPTWLSMISLFGLVILVLAILSF